MLQCSTNRYRKGRNFMRDVMSRKKTFCSVVLQKDTKVLIRTYAARCPDFFPKQEAENAGEKRAINCRNAITLAQATLNSDLYGEAITAYVAHERAAGAQNNVVSWGSVICLMVRHQRRYVISRDPITCIVTRALMQWFLFLSDKLGNFDLEPFSFSYSET